MPIIDARKIKGVRVKAPYERIIKVLLAPDTQDDVKEISITMGIIYPHSRNDLHTHEGTEILYIVTGHGKAVMGDKTFEIGPDCIIVATPGLPHQQINESDETMKMYAVWTPAVTGKEVLDRALKAAGEKTR